MHTTFIRRKTVVFDLIADCLQKHHYSYQSITAESSDKIQGTIWQVCSICTVGDMVHIYFLQEQSVSPLSWSSQGYIAIFQKCQGILLTTQVHEQALPSAILTDKVDNNNKFTRLCFPHLKFEIGYYWLFQIDLPLNHLQSILTIKNNLWPICKKGSYSLFDCMYLANHNFQCD